MAQCIQTAKRKKQTNKQTKQKKKLTNNTLPGKTAKIGEVAETGPISCTIGRNINW